MMEYKGYIGKVDFDDEVEIFHGEVINTRDVITFQGNSVKELKRAFKDSVDDYLSFCAERGEEPDKPYSGRFVARIPPELHREVSVAASIEGVSLNAWVQKRLKNAVQQSGIHVVQPSKKKGRRPASTSTKNAARKRSSRRSAEAEG